MPTTEEVGALARGDAGDVEQPGAIALAEALPALHIVSPADLAAPAELAPVGEVRLDHDLESKLLCPADRLLDVVDRLVGAPAHEAGIA